MTNHLFDLFSPQALTLRSNENYVQSPGAMSPILDGLFNITGLRGSGNKAYRTWQSRQFLAQQSPDIFLVAINSFDIKEHNLVILMVVKLLQVATVT